jgi:hypothetical protein
MARSRILDGLNWSNAASEMIRAYNYTESRLPRNPVLLKNSPVDGL